MPDFDSNYTKADQEDQYAIFDNNGERTNFFRIFQLWVKNNRVRHWPVFAAMAFLWIMMLTTPNLMHGIFIAFNAIVVIILLVILLIKGYNKFMDWFTSL